MPRTMIVFGVLFGIALAASLVGFVHEAFRTISITGLLLSPIFTIALVAATFWAWQQFRSWQSLAIVEQLQSDLSNPCETRTEQERFRKSFAQLRSKVSEPQLVKFLRSANVMTNVVNLQDGLDRIGLKGMDKKAIDAIRDGTRDVFVLSLVSSNAIVEVIIFVFRAFGLIRRVASAYGYRPGRPGVIRLARHIMADIALLPIGMLVGLEVGRQAGSAIRSVTNGLPLAAVAAGPHVALAAAAIGTIGSVVGGVAESVSPRVVEATMASVRIAHLGLLAAAIVRPVAFSQSGYEEIRNAVAKQILLLNKEEERNKSASDAALSTEASAS
jgi:uncharacterized membrane protein YcjF (UPF0283 family)